MKTNAKTFLHALTLLGRKPEKAKVFLNDKRLTVQEKAILKSMLLLRDNKFEEVLELISNISASDPFVESQRLQTLGGAYNNKGDPKKAIYFYNKSLDHDDAHGIPVMDFHTYYCLFILHLNFQDIKKMRSCFSKMKQFNIRSAFGDLCILTCQFHIQMSEQKYNEASDSLEELETLLPKMAEFQKMNFYIDKFDLGLRLEDYDMSRQCLEDMKQIRKFRLSANFKYMKSLLENFVQEAPMYVYEQDFIDHPILHHQLMVIKHLEEDNTEEAQKYWQKLETMNPEIYKEKFSYQGQLCIFGLCLDRYLRNKKSLILPHSDSISKEDLLFMALETSNKPLSKEKIFQIVYGDLPESKFDLQKLKSLICLVKKKKNIRIQYKKGCYVIAS